MSEDEGNDGSAIDKAPESWHHRDEDTLRSVDKWIDEGHPHQCAERLQELADAGGVRFRTLTLRLLAHYIAHEDHEASIEQITSVVEQYYPTHTHELGLADAIQTRQSTLVDEVVENLEDLAQTDAGINAVSLINRHVDEEEFRRVWDAVWASESASRFPGLVNEVLANALGLGYCMDDANERVVDRTMETFHICGPGLVRRLMTSDPLRDHREEKLNHLLDEGGVEAARMIIQSSRAVDDKPEALVRATKLIYDERPDSETAKLGVGLCLTLDPDFALPIVVEWAHDFDNGIKWTSQLHHLVQQADQEHLMKMLAEDALEKPDIAHELLAREDHNLEIDPDVAYDWCRDNIHREEARYYVSTLMARYLSDEYKRVAKIDDEEEAQHEEWADGMVELAEELHGEHGARSRKEALMEYHLDDEDADSLLVAVQLCRDVNRRPSSPSPMDALETAKEYPATYEVLGGEELDELLETDPLEFVPLSMYEEDLEEELRDLELRWARGEIAQEGYQMKRHHLARAWLFRTTWEGRFQTLLDLGYEPGDDIDGSRLRTEQDYWPEIALLSKLAPHFDEIDYERSDLPETEGSELDFLLKCDDGELFLEVTAIGKKPEEVLEGVTISPGVKVKKKVQNKLQDQFNDGDVDLQRPALIAVQVKWENDLTFDALNSLYGPQQMAHTIKQDTGTVVSEGARRKREWALFEEERATCLSGVITFTRGVLRPHLNGRIHLNPDDPDYPLNRDLYVRLRDALFSREPADRVQEMLQIPTIRLDEARKLVAAGIDEFSRFAGDLYDRPEELSMSEERYQALQEEARWLSKIRRTGEIRFLKSAEGVDLTPCYEADIYTLGQLRRAVAPPEDMDPDVWAEMKREASGL